MADIEKGITTLHEQVSKAIELCYTAGYNCNKCPYYNQYDCNHWLMRDALFMLKKQEAIEPHLDVDEWKCGNCGHDLEHQEMLGDNVLFHEQYNYCPRCGRAVKWE